MIMEKDATMSELYKTFYSEVKGSHEHEMENLKDIHARFDDMYNEERMSDKLDTRWYDPKDLDDENEIVYSTDFTDEADDL
jgi:hypothetical protein